MPILAELYVATRTRNTADADTENLPVLVVQRGSDVVFTKPLFGGDFRTARGAGAVWRFDVREVNLDSADLSVQLWASGNDAWSPEHVIAWGVSGRVGDERVIPLAAFLDLATADPSRYLVLDASLDSGQISKEIQAAVRDRLPDPVPEQAEEITGSIPVIRE